MAAAAESSVAVRSLQLEGKALGTAGLAEVLAAAAHQQQQRQQQRRGRQRRGQWQEPDPENEGPGAAVVAVTALDASSNGLEALPLSVPQALFVLQGLQELRLAHNALTGDLAAFASLRQLVHLGAFTSESIRCIFISIHLSSA